MTQETLALAGEARGADKLAQWVQRRESVIAHDATNSIWHQVPAYADRADAGLRDDVEAHCRQVFAAFLASVTERRHPQRADFPWSGQHATRRVELGITLSDFMKAFRVGQLTLWDDILAGVDEWPSTKDAALLLVNQVMRTIEVGSTSAAEAYLEVQQYQLADSARLARDLLEDLLAGKPPTVEERQLALAHMGLADGAPIVALVAMLPSTPVGTRQRARLRAVQTPQAFRPGALQSAYALWEAVEPPTDEARVAEVAGLSVALASNCMTVPGDVLGPAGELADIFAG